MYCMFLPFPGIGCYTSSEWLMAWTSRLCSVKLTTILPLSRQYQQLEPKCSGSQSVTSKRDLVLGLCLFSSIFCRHQTFPWDLSKSCRIWLSCHHQGLRSDERVRAPLGDLEQLVAMLWAKRGTEKGCLFYLFFYFSKRKAAGNRRNKID